MKPLISEEELRNKTEEMTKEELIELLVVLHGVHSLENEKQAHERAGLIGTYAPRVRTLAVSLVVSWLLSQAHREGGE